MSADGLLAPVRCPLPAGKEEFEGFHSIYQHLSRDVPLICAPAELMFASSILR